MYIPSVSFRLTCGDGYDMVTPGTVNDDDGLCSLSLYCLVNVRGLGDRSVVLMMATLTSTKHFVLCVLKAH